MANNTINKDCDSKNESQCDCLKFGETAITRVATLCTVGSLRADPFLSLLCGLRIPTATSSI